MTEIKIFLIDCRVGMGLTGWDLLRMKGMWIFIYFGTEKTRLDEDEGWK